MLSDLKPGHPKREAALRWMSGSFAREAAVFFFFMSSRVVTLINRGMETGTDGMNTITIKSKGFLDELIPRNSTITCNEFYFYNVSGDKWQGSEKSFMLGQQEFLFEVSNPSPREEKI